MNISASKNQKENFSPFNYFLIITIVNVLLISLAIIFYKGAFDLWEYPLSYAGAKFTYLEVAPNNLSSFIYSLAMIASGLVMFILGYKFVRSKSGRFKIILSFLAAFGFILAGFSPDDIRHTSHVVGSAAFVFALWLFTTAYINEAGKYQNANKMHWFQYIFQFFIITYAITYFTSLDKISAPIQKFALFGLFVSLLYSTYFLKKKKQKS